MMLGKEKASMKLGTFTIMAQPIVVDLCCFVMGLSFFVCWIGKKVGMVGSNQ